MTWLRNILSTGTVESSKRLCMVLSYVVSLIYAGVCIVFTVPLDPNILTLLLGAISASTTGYVFGLKSEDKKVDTNV